MLRTWDAPAHRQASPAETAVLVALLIAVVVGLTVALFAGQHQQDRRLDKAEPTVVAGRSWA